MSKPAIHAARRTASFAIAGNSVSVPGLPIRFGPIDAAACGAFSSSWSPQSKRQVPWDWHQMAGQYAHSHWARLELAIWSDAVLCGLALGRFSAAQSVLAVNFVEGAPFQHPLRGRILVLALGFAETLGIAYNSGRLRFTWPAPYVASTLTAVGFSHVHASKKSPYYPYCERLLP